MRHAHPHIFLSYGHHDSDFVCRLRADLESRGADVWLDVKRIAVGDSISEAVEKALECTDYFCLVISSTSLSRNWVQREYRAALSLQLSRGGKKPRILPIMKDAAPVPMLLRDIRCADFAGNYRIAFESLCSATGLPNLVAPFLEVLTFLGSDDEARTRRLAHINIWKIAEIAEFAEIMKKTSQQALRELQANSTADLRLLPPERIPELVRRDHRYRAIVRLPEVSMGTYHAGDAEGGDNIPIIVPFIEGMEPLIEALSAFTTEVRQRRVYFLPQSVGFHWPGPMDGDPIDELVDFGPVFLVATRPQ